MEIVNDKKTAEAFDSSWNNLPIGSIYTKDQFEDWFLPLTKNEIEGKSILELGCGNASLLVYIAFWGANKIVGVDLGSSVITAHKNMEVTGFKNFEIRQADLTKFTSEGFDLVYCMGVLHHLQNPFEGLQSVIKNTKRGGRFHCWVYAKEGNGVIRYIVDPIRKGTSKLPWWLTKYFIATPLSFIYFLYAHFIVLLKLRFMPLYDYSKWICKRGFLFFRHVAFDQLVTPQTVYISKNEIENWLTSLNEIEPKSSYIIFRNGNSWKFGGTKKLR